MSIDEQLSENFYNRFSKDEVNLLVSSGILPEETILYNKRYSVKDIISLIKSNISSKKALQYDKNRFEVEGIIKLIKDDISPGVTDQYSIEFDCENIFFNV